MENLVRRSDVSEMPNILRSLVSSQVVVLQEKPTAESSVLLGARKEYSCSQCTVKSASNQDMEAHINSVHTGNYIECGWCQSRFWSGAEFQIHCDLRKCLEQTKKNCEDQ